MGVNALKILRGWGSSPFVLRFLSLQSWLSSYCRGPTHWWTPAGQILGCSDPCGPCGVDDYAGRLSERTFVSGQPQKHHSAVPSPTACRERDRIMRKEWGTEETGTESTKGAREWEKKTGVAVAYFKFGIFYLGTYTCLEKNRPTVLY